ncbi:MAG: MBL fold metallo-hydrolase [Patescibacteria group bacterium]
MVITWYGQACFKIQSGDLVVAIDPFSKDIGLTPPRFKADVALVTHGHFDHNNIASLAGEPFVITGPGEFEVKGITVRGISTYHDKVLGKERGMNTIYRIEMEGISLLHMGDFGEEKVREETLEEIGDVDVLMVPVGGTYTITGTEAAKITKQIEPAFVIPMHYKLSGVKANLESAEQFLKDMGASKTEIMEKLTIKKKDIPEEGKAVVVVLNAT